MFFSLNGFLWVNCKQKYSSEIPLEGGHLNHALIIMPKVQKIFFFLGTWETGKQFFCLVKVSRRSTHTFLSKGF